MLLIETFQLEPDIFEGRKISTFAAKPAPAAGRPDDDSAHILVIDDDRRIRELLKSYLSENGFRISVADSAAQARDRMRGLEFDLLILDVMMPGESGLELAASLRDTSKVPILMLTARTDSQDRIAGLETGVDDYLSKPFEPRELLLRINNVLRRQEPTAPVPVEIVMGNCSFHIERGELRQNDTTVRLTTRERDLLRIFALNPGRAISRNELSGDTSSGSARAVDVQVNRLRRKIEPDPTTPVYLQTVRGAGYILYTD